MKTVALIVMFLGTVCAEVAIAANPPALRVREKYLLLDKRLISSVDNAALRLGIVKKHPANPLFVDELPWEAHGSHMYPNVVFVSLSSSSDVRNSSGVRGLTPLSDML